MLTQIESIVKFISLDFTYTALKSHASPQILRTSSRKALIRTFPFLRVSPWIKDEHIKHSVIPDNISSLPVFIEAETALVHTGLVVTALYIILCGVQ